MNTRQIRIDIKDEKEFWAEQVLGNIVKYAVDKIKPKWFWFTRYQYDDQRYILVRYLDDGSFEQELIKRCKKYKLVYKVDEYDIVEDLGGDRFSVSPDNNVGANVFIMLGSLAKIILDNLVQVRGRWMPLHSTHKQNPNGSIFQSLLHIFCNMTQVPMDVFLYEKDGHLEIGTRWMVNPDRVKSTNGIRINY